VRFLLDIGIPPSLILLFEILKWRLSWETASMLLKLRSCLSLWLLGLILLINSFEVLVFSRLPSALLSSLWLTVLLGGLGFVDFILLDFLWRVFLRLLSHF
jgi:hypothetical protein